MKTFVALLVVAGLWVACGDSERPPADPGGNSRPSTSSQDYEGTWKLTEGRSPEGEIAILEGWRITMLIERGTVGGISACNHYGADAVIDGNSFDVGGVGGTEMACKPEVMEAEARYHSALIAADAIGREGDVLTVAGQDVELVYEFVPPPPTASLIGVTWHLEAILYGRGPDATAASVDPAELRLNADQTITGYTGCKPMEGTWAQRGDMIVFDRFGVEGRCPERLEEQHGRVINIGDGFTFEIEGRILTIYPRHGNVGLMYRAAD